MVSLSTLSKVVELNNDGARSFEGGDFLGAKSCFKKALQSLQLSVNEEGSSLPSKESRPCPVHFCWSDETRLPIHTINGPLSSGSTYVYRRAIYMTTTICGRSSHPHGAHAPSCGDDPLGVSSTETACAVVFNLGLSFHMLGVLRNETSTLAAGMRFYELAASIRRPTPDTRLEMAILNNLGSICVEMVNYRAARVCFDQVSTYLKRLSENGSLYEILEQTDCAGFVMNVILAEPSLAAAA